MIPTLPMAHGVRCDVINRTWLAKATLERWSEADWPNDTDTREKTAITPSVLPLGASNTAVRMVPGGITYKTNQPWIWTVISNIPSESHFITVLSDFRDRFQKYFQERCIPQREGV